MLCQKSRTSSHDQILMQGRCIGPRHGWMGWQLSPIEILFGSQTGLRRDGLCEGYRGVSVTHSADSVE
jgi:hypothetical protein